MSEAPIIVMIAALGGLIGAIVCAIALRLINKQASPAEILAPRFDRIDGANERMERELRGEIRDSAQSNRQELSHNVAQFQQTLGQQMANIATVQNNQIDGFAQQLVKLTDANEARLSGLQAAVDERLQGFARDARAGREESANTLKRFGDGLNAQLAEVRATMEARLKDIETQNASKLDEMRKTVDEKLHATLEQRLGESFKLVSDRLEAVHKGLGEMQTLAIGVGDLKRVLTNVKSRGAWAKCSSARCWNRC